MSTKFWHVYNYIARQWYEQEYGQTIDAERYYQPAMLMLESMAYETNRTNFLAAPHCRIVSISEMRA